MGALPRDAAACADLALASAGTAASHLRAAELLLACQQWPQAQALAVFAYEEAGKACMRVCEMVSPPELARFWQQRDADKEQHVRKLTIAQNISMMIELFIGDRQADGGARSLHERS